MATRAQGIAAAAALALASFVVAPHAHAASTEASPGVPAHQADAAEIGAKLSNPVSDVWALFTEFDLYFSDGNLDENSPEVGGRMIFQPVMPFPIHGTGDEEWKLITRPIIPILFSQPVPTAPDDFDHPGGVADITLPMLIAPPTGHWLVGFGPTWLFPSATDDAFGRQQWGVGPTAVLGYSTKKFVAGVFPQYYFGIGSRGDRPPGVADASYMSLLYFAFLNLPDAWQVGFNPTITYDHQASSGNQWDVPVGIVVAKTTKFGRMPVKFQLGIEYLVVSPNEFGQRAQIKLNVIPVIPALVRKPILGGG